VTNVVKHFKWRPSDGGTRRIHDKPNWTEIQACLPWFHAELELVQPEVVVCLGATAAQALLGRDLRVSRSRGKRVESPLAPTVVATIHPSAVLRAGERRRRELAGLVADLRAARKLSEAASLEEAP
jgi:uracil-DNA glycosylase family 4